MKSSNGFTLIELMIVMAIVALLMSFVGPMAMNSLERAEAKSELLELKQVLLKSSQKAFSSGKRLTVKLNGKLLEIVNSDSPKVLKSSSFDYLFFQPTEVTFNNRGLTESKLVKGLYRNRELQIDVYSLITGSTPSLAEGDDV